VPDRPRIEPTFDAPAPLVTSAEMSTTKVKQAYCAHCHTLHPRPSLQARVAVTVTGATSGYSKDHLAHVHTSRREILLCRDCVEEYDRTWFSRGLKRLGRTILTSMFPWL
jgi:formate-dependent nitrite reductase cytochrome c552 subunit